MGAMTEAVPGEGDKIFGPAASTEISSAHKLVSSRVLAVRGGRHISERTPVQIWHYQPENAPGLEHPQRITQRRGQLVPCKVVQARDCNKLHKRCYQGSANRVRCPR